MSSRISEIESIFKELFSKEENAKVYSVDTVYEKTDAGLYKLVITLYGLSYEGVSVIHTKFIFMVNEEKTLLVENSMSYLYDINCYYHTKTFKDLDALSDMIYNIIISRNFGKDLKIISDFNESPAMLLNHYLSRDEVIKYSVFEVVFNPKFKSIPCDRLTFDFDININNLYNVALSIKKTDEDKNPAYYLYFSFMDDKYDLEIEDLNNLHADIARGLTNILDKKLNTK